MENLKENKDDVASAELYNPAFLKSLSLNVKTVIDVGVLARHRFIKPSPTRILFL